MSGSGEEQRAAEDEVDGGELVGMSSPEKNKHNRKQYHRHTPQQIQAMKEFFKDCAHPDNQQRIELSKDIGIEPLQVKFWFQNKRTQMKMMQEHQQNTNLRAESAKLRAESVRLGEALSNATCSVCGCMATVVDVSFEERHLRMENTRLRDEIIRISRVAANYVGKPLTNPPINPSSYVLSATNLGTGSMFRGPPSDGKDTQDCDDENENIDTV